jgi:hypothetical protein
MKFLSDDGGAEYNLCMCMSFLLPGPAVDQAGWMLIMARCKIVYNNFEISDLDFWRGEAYTTFFNHLDRSGGFYYEVRSHLSVTHEAFQVIRDPVRTALGRCSRSLHRRGAPRGHGPHPLLP